jgi:hypothetical protein
LPSHDDEAGLLAGHELLDHHARAAGVVRHAQRVVASMSSMAACASSSVIATTTPLPAARPSALMTMGAPCVHVGVRGRGVGEGGVARGGDAVALHEVLGKGLGALQLRGRLGGAEDAQAAGAEHVHHAGGQRRLGADHGQRDLVRPAKSASAAGR